MDSEHGALTDSADWDAYWADTRLPAEARRGDRLNLDRVLDVFDRYTAGPPGRSLLEVGGAPGGYAAYLHRRFGFTVDILDISPEGRRLAHRNFDLLGIPAVIHAGDVFDAHARLPRYDLVYSLGLIEHFKDTSSVAAAHARYVKPGGILIVGCPNFLGINQMIIRRLSPSLLDEVDLAAMELTNWKFEVLGLERLFLGYVGGFEPLMFWRCESSRRVDRFLWLALQVSGRICNLRALAPLRRLNSRRWSGYALGVYRVRS